MSATDKFPLGTWVRITMSGSVFRGWVGRIVGPMEGRFAPDQTYRRVQLPKHGTLHIHVDDLREVDLIERIGDLDLDLGCE